MILYCHLLVLSREKSFEASSPTVAVIYLLFINIFEMLCIKSTDNSSQLVMLAGHQDPLSPGDA